MPLILRLLLVDVEQSYVRFLGNLILNLWDCGGQEAFMECYFATQKDNIFKNVEVLIYVFDAESREIEKVRSHSHFTLVSSALHSICRIYTTINRVWNRSSSTRPVRKSSALSTKWI